MSFQWFRKKNKYMWEKWKDNDVCIYDLNWLIVKVNYHTKFWSIMKKKIFTTLSLTRKRPIEYLIKVSYFVDEKPETQRGYMPCPKSHVELSKDNSSLCHPQSLLPSSYLILFSERPQKTSLIIDINRGLVEKPFYSIFSVPF